MMVPSATNKEPKDANYDVVVVGGAIMGSSIAWFLTANVDFDGRVLVVERDPTYAKASTSHTNSCIRQQFSNKLNIEMSQFAAEFVKNFRRFLGDDPEIPEIVLQSFGYMYLANSQEFAAVLRDNQKLQNACGAATRILTPEQISAEYPFYNLDDIVVGSHNPRDEGYFDGNTIFDWLRRKARQNGAEYIANEVVAIDRADGRVNSVTLESGTVIGVGTIVNASGPRADRTAQMVGVDLPIEPRRRFTFVFEAAKPLDRELPLTIDPSGIHVRSDGAYYLCGCPPDADTAVHYDDFSEDHDIWEAKLWPALANRIPAFDAVKVVNSWVGHYAYNTLDHNAVIGPHPEIDNFIFANGFSGHGLQQSPATGRGISELITYGSYRALDLSPLGYDRIVLNQPFLERAVI